MSIPKLKIDKLPDTTQHKVGIVLDPVLKADLKTYTQVFEATYGQQANIATLIPLMLRAFLASDSGFKKVRAEFVKNDG